MSYPLNSQRILLRAAAFSFLFLWITGFVLPCLNPNLLYTVYPFQKMIYSNICHQDFNKSFTCNDASILVCARCTGIYFGAFINSLIILVGKFNIKLKTKYLYILSTPMLMDVIIYSLGIYHYNKFIALSTGILFGSSIFLYILGGIEYLLFIKQKT